MNDIKIFQSDDFGRVRTTTDENGEVWFCAADVCSILQYANTSDAIRYHVNEKGVEKFYTLTERGEQLLSYVNEGGLYDLVFGSKLPKAKEFKLWVTDEVLPSIRKHGQYQLPTNPQQRALSPAQLRALADHIECLELQVAEKQRMIEQREQQLEQQQPQVLFAMAVQTSNDSILVGDLAKLLRQNGVDTGRNRLFKTLRREGYIIHNSTMPTQRAMELGLFEIKESTVTMPDGGVRITQTPKVTGKGQVYFVNRFLNAN